MREEIGMPTSKPFHPARIHYDLWTPDGPRSLAELPFERGEWKPCLLGTFNMDALERPLADAGEDGASAPSEHTGGLVHINKDFTSVCYPSHDSDPVLVWGQGTRYGSPIASVERGSHV